jgi:arabinofuranan 3-O-arabinosyltransferase
VVLANEAPRRACVDIGYGPHCETSEIRTTEWNGLDRRLTVVDAGAWTLSGSVVAEADASAAGLLAPIDDTAAAATSSSVFGGDPAVSAVFAFDGTAETQWLADPDESRATLNLSWTGERTVSRLAIDRARVPAAEPVRARIESSAGVRDVDLRDLGFFEPLPARDGLSITFYRSPSSEAGLPLGIGEVHVDGLEDLKRGLWLQGRGPTGSACGLGPEIRIDGTAHRTEVTGTLRDVAAGRPLTWRACDGPVALSPGVHRVVAEATPQFQPLSLIWRPGARGSLASEDGASGDGATGSDESSRLRVTSWGDVRRVVSVTSGPAAILRIAENVNEGWRATLDGDVLEPVVLDGWQQGYRIPAGSAGDVVVEFAPDRSYRGLLLGGFALAVALVVLAALGLRRSRAGRPGLRADLTSPSRALGVGTALAAGLGGLVVGGLPLAVGWAAGLTWPTRRYATALGVTALVASGALVATSPGLQTGGAGVWADTTAALGLGLLLTRLVHVRRPRMAGRRARRVR